jgi:ATP-dependent Clp protease ATP-binding subunit ClpC
MYPFERFSENAKGVLTFAQGQAERARHSYIGTEHLLLGLMEEGSGLAAAALRNMGLQLTDLEADVEVALRNAPHESRITQIIPTSRVKRVIELAFDEAHREGMSQVETSHLLSALLIEGQGIGAQVLAARGVTVNRVSAEVARLRAAGKAEGHGSGPSPIRRHLALTDEKDRPVAIDVLFPRDYSADEQDDLMLRIHQAVEGKRRSHEAGGEEGQKS